MHVKAFFKKLECARIYVVWQKGNETDFILTMNFIIFTNQGYPLQNSSLGQLHSDGGVVSIVRSSAGRLLLEGIIQLVGYTLLDIIKSTKMAPFQVVFEPGNKKKSQGLKSGK